MARALAIAAICASLGIAACGEDDDDSGADADATTPATSPAETTATGGEEPEKSKDREGAGDKPGITIETAESEFGEILFDGDDQAIYIFDKESSDQSECYGECAAAWPPVLTEGDPEAGAGADEKLLGTTERDDGSTQVTYDGRPLYYYVDDGPGQVLCHNVEEFGGLWLVVEPGGAPVT
jgi:predicted lipoprotein with Yx(FWY)xxD motif